MKYKCHFCTQCGQCGQFSAPTAPTTPSVEILKTEFFFICIGTTFITCIFYKICFFLKKYCKKSSSYISKKMVICNFNMQHHLAPSRAMCQKLPIFMANKMVKIGPPLSPPNWSN